MRRLLLSLCLAAASSLLAQTAPDLIIMNAKVFTGDPANRWAEAVAITGDHISAVGTNDQVKSTAGDGTRWIDAKGHVVIPGLNIAHENVCTTPAMRLMTSSDATAQDVLNAVAGAVDESPVDVWVSGTIGKSALNDPALTTAALDKVSQGHRVVLQSADGNAVIVNSAALSALRMNDSDPMGGWWQHDATTGRSNGKAFGYAAYNVMQRWGDQTSEEDELEALKTWGDNAAKLGVTTAQVTPCLTYKRFERFVRRATLPIRLHIIPMPGTSSDARNVDELRELGKPYGPRAALDVSGTAWDLGGAKPNFAATEIAAMMKEGQPLLLISDDPKTTAMALDAARAAGVKRVRLESGVTADAVPALRDLGAVVVQRGATTKDNVLKSLVKAGVPVAIATDGSPWEAFEMAVTSPASSQEALTREQAADAFTRGAAYAEMAENDKGVLAPGRIADLAVLSQDVFTVSSSRIPETSSLLTIVGGKIVYDAHLLTMTKR